MFSHEIYEATLCIPKTLSGWHCIYCWKGKLISDDFVCLCVQLSENSTWARVKDVVRKTKLRNHSRLGAASASLKMSCPQLYRWGACSTPQCTSMICSQVQKNLDKRPFCSFFTFCRGTLAQMIRWAANQGSVYSWGPIREAKGGLLTSDASEADHHQAENVPLSFTRTFHDTHTHNTRRLMYLHMFQCMFVFLHKHKQNSRFLLTFSKTHIFLFLLLL